MSFEVKEISLKSADDIHTLSGKIYIPSGEIKGLFHIVHGMNEYIGRYDCLMSHLAENGYVSFGYDNLGHGNTVLDYGELGFISNKNGWKFLVDDVAACSSLIQNQYPNKPLYLMGHSMGSFIARLTFCKFPQIYQKLIVCGTSGKNPLATLGIMLTNVIGFFRGKRYVSKLILDMAFSSYNKRFEGKTDYEWLTKDTEVINKYSKDKFCTFKFSVSAMNDLITLISKCNSADWFKRIDKDKPILLISGKDDPVGNYGKGVKWIFERLKKNGCNVKMKLYENCRHEILNDSCREEVLCDILNFLK